MNVALRVEGLGKKYRIGHSKSGALRETFDNFFLSNRSELNRNHKKDFWALKNISVEIDQGEAVGIIGRNGAGKSTLLKILSKITEPTTGRAELIGRISSLLEVGTGFHPELSGRENIYLNGTILGMKRNEVKAKFDEIVSFSGVEKFIDTPIKHYSSGMKVRLAFSVAAFLEPEILVIDEVLAVGDMEFQKKCLGKMEDVSKAGRTVIFVSHNMGVIRQLCSRVLVLEKGELVSDSGVDSGISFYNNLIYSSNTYQEHLDLSKDAQVLKVDVKNSQGKPTNIFAHNEGIVLEIEYRISSNLKGKKLLVSLINNINRRVFSSEMDIKELGKQRNSCTAIMKIPSDRIAPGDYSFLVAIHDPIKGIKASIYLSGISPISVYDGGSKFVHFQDQWFFGDVFIDCEWEYPS